VAMIVVDDVKWSTIVPVVISTKPLCFFPRITMKTSTETMKQWDDSQDVIAQRICSDKQKAQTWANTFEWSFDARWNYAI